ncbi:MAG: hypothetical protein ACLQU3_02530 [Limisphaerales bacterium]
MSARPTVSETPSNSYEPEQKRFLETVGAARSAKAGPVLEFRLPGARLLRQVDEINLDKLA